MVSKMNHRVKILVILVAFCVFPCANSWFTSGNWWNKINFLWISDIHLDLYYKASASSDWPNSCRNESIPDSFIGPIGKIGCDSPKSLLDNLVKGMNQKYKKSPKFILLSGDSCAHNMDEGFTDGTTRKERVLKAMRTVAEEIAAAYPSVPFFPSIGNNDIPGHYVLPEPDDSWYADLLEFWEDLIICARCKPHEQTTTRTDLRRTFLNGGYYKAKVPGTKITMLVLNSMYWGLKTWRPDSYFVKIADEQMSWLKNELIDARRLGTKVLISSHVPPGTDTFPKDGEYPKLWLANYTDIYLNLVTTLYSDVIAGQLYGHFHVDDYRLLESETDVINRKLSFILLAPSVSPVYKNNPNFRVVEMDIWQRVLSNYKQYYMDLVMATAFDNPVWLLDYEFSKKYPPVGSKDKVINGARIKNLNDQLINQNNNKIFTGYSVSRTVRYHSDAPFSRFAFYCAMKHLRGEDFEKCHESLKVPGG